MRTDYINLLWEYENAVGTIKKGSQLMPAHPAIKQIEEMLRTEWSKTVSLMEEARQREAERKG